MAFRSGPSTGDGIIDRFDNGREVRLIEQSGDWSHVRDQLTQRDGWMASRFLGDLCAGVWTEANDCDSITLNNGLRDSNGTSTHRSGEVRL
ncbi:SH3 domain-containing protein, partial [Sinorhizobium psoraleae]|uniref:SH3 domain-containing protein n=1 Tax=Sinorhizobium psoraleae TaxID=520838 RepID=UPI00156A66B4